MRHGLLDAPSLQRMLYEVLDHSDDIVIVLEQLGDGPDDICIVSANDAFCRATGYSHADLIGRPMRLLLAPDSDQARCAEMIQAAHERRSFRSELLCSRHTGAPFWFGLHLMAVPDTSPPCFVILGRDITEALHARQQQSAIQGLLAKVFLCIKAPVAIVSDKGLIQMTNPALDELLGRPAGAAVGTPSVNYIVPNARAAALAARQRQLAGGPDYTICSKILRSDGVEVPVELTSVAMQREDLRRFRIVTLTKLPDDAPTKVHVAGKVRLIGLDEVKSAFGPRWAEVRARVMASAEHVIRRRCGQLDTFTRTDDGGFLICFADASEEEAGFRAAAMAREIRARLIGEGETAETATVSAIAATVELPHVPGRSPDMLASLIGERLSQRLVEIEARARETLQQAVRIATGWLEPVRSRRARDVVAHFVRLPAQQEQRILAAYSTLPSSERETFDFDRLVLGIAADQAITEIAEGGSLLMLVNVDFEVFLDRRRTERYVAACQALDGRLRERLVLVLTGMPRGFPRSRALDCVMRLRPFCHGVGFQSAGLDAPVVDSSLLGTSIVVLRGDDRTAVDPVRLAKLIESLHAHQARVLVRHVASWAEARPLVQMGVDLVSLVDDERCAAGHAAA